MRKNATSVLPGMFETGGACSIMRFWLLVAITTGSVVTTVITASVGKEA